MTDARHTVHASIRRRRQWLSMIGVVAGLVTCLPVTAKAHPIHTTLTAATSDGRGITFTVRTFADDFSASVARFAGKAPAADSSVLAADVATYLDAHIRIVDAAGNRLRLRSCGIRRARELYWLCLRLDGTPSLKGMTVQNRLLTEIHDDQVNIVQVDIGSVRRTVLFTKHTGAQPLVN